MHYSRLALLIATLMTAQNLYADVASFTGSGIPSDSWNVANNWSTGIVPNDPTRDVEIGSLGLFDVHLSSSTETSIKSLAIAEGSSLTLNPTVTTSLTIYGATVANDGEIFLPNSTSTLKIPNDVSFTGSGVVILDHASAAIFSVNSATENYKLVNGPTHTIRGRGTLGQRTTGSASGSFWFDNQGLICADVAGATLTLKVPPAADGDENVNTGIIEARNGATLRVIGRTTEPMAVLRNHAGDSVGTIAARAGSTITFSGGGGQFPSYTTHVIGGLIHAEGGGVIQMDGGKFSDTTFQLDEGSLLKTWSISHFSGTVNVQGDGEFHVMDDETYIDSNATLTMQSKMVVEEEANLIIEGRINTSNIQNDGDFLYRSTDTNGIHSISGNGGTVFYENTFLNLDTIRQQSFQISGTSELRLDFHHPSDFETPNISRMRNFGAGQDANGVPALIDIGMSVVILDNGTNQSPNGIRFQLQQAYADGAWNARWMTSSDAAEDPRLGIGYAKASAIFDTPTVWHGESLTETSRIIRTTYYGDSDLDGDVDFSDLLTVAQNYGMVETLDTGFWWQGDFNYDGEVNFEDLLTVAQQYGLNELGGADALNFVNSPTGSFESDWTLARSMVPEPGVVSLIGIVGLAMGRRKKKTRDKSRR